MFFFFWKFGKQCPGDGVVGQLDYFIGKCFDKDGDGRLTTRERARAEKASELKKVVIFSLFFFFGGVFNIARTLGFELHEFSGNSYWL